jgi:hypothetical protein
LSATANICVRSSEGSLVDAVEHAEMVEKQLDAMIQRRARKEDVDPDEREEIWKASVRAYTAREREEMRAAWASYHEGQAERHRRTLQDLIAPHETQAAKLCEGEGVRS